MNSLLNGLVVLVKQSANDVGDEDFCRAVAAHEVAVSCHLLSRTVSYYFFCVLFFLRVYDLDGCKNCESGSVWSALVCAFVFCQPLLENFAKFLSGCKKDSSRV